MNEDTGGWDRFAAEVSAASSEGKHLVITPDEGIYATRVDEPPAGEGAPA